MPNRPNPSPNPPPSNPRPPHTPPMRDASVHIERSPLLRVPAANAGTPAPLIRAVPAAVPPSPLPLGSGDRDPYCGPVVSYVDGWYRMETKP